MNESLDFRDEGFGEILDAVSITKKLPFMMVDEESIGCYEPPGNPRTPTFLPSPRDNAMSQFLFIFLLITRFNDVSKINNISTKSK